MAKKISPKLEKEILAKAAEQYSNRDIAKWLKDERGIKISHQAVGNMLRQTRDARAEVAKVVVRQTLGKTIVSDLDRLNREQNRVERLGRRMYRRAIAALDALEGAAVGTMSSEDLKVAIAGVGDFADLALKATDRVTKLAGVKLHLSGADAENDQSRGAASASDELLAKLDSLADRLSPGERPESGDPEASEG